ncbi:MAG: hypothetical protein RJB38_1410 [Pseudomonadota bacterium]|jgi:hypothetical protein
MPQALLDRKEVHDFEKFKNEAFFKCFFNKSETNEKNRTDARTFTESLGEKKIKNLGLLLAIQKVQGNNYLEFWLSMTKLQRRRKKWLRRKLQRRRPLLRKKPLRRRSKSFCGVLMKAPGKPGAFFLPINLATSLSKKKQGEENSARKNSSARAQELAPRSEVAINPQRTGNSGPP